MPFVTVEHDSNQMTIVNTDQVTYLREDLYGTAIHFSSGEHVICPMDIDAMSEKLFGKAGKDSLMLVR